MNTNTAASSLTAEQGILILDLICNEQARVDREHGERLRAEIEKYDSGEQPSKFERSVTDRTKARLDELEKLYGAVRDAFDI